MTKASKESSMTPLMKQYYAVKNQHKESLVLFRMGDFFETFDDDAKNVSKILGITLTKRANGAAAQVPLAGFPHHALDTYLPKLVAAGKRIAICEQVEDPKLAKGIVKREVVEVVTPGTASPDDEGHTKNNFLSAVCRSDSTMGLSLLDLSTGEFFLAEGSGETVRDLFLKFAPSEIIVAEGEEVSKSDWVTKVNPFVTEMDQWTFDHDLSRTALLEHFKVASLKGFGCEEMPAGVTAAGVILRYVTQNIQSAAGHITRLVPLRPENEMGLDNFTVRNLELFTSLATQGTHGTLLSVLDETVTAGGARMLRSRMARPITDREAIENRLDLVDGFFTEEKLRSDFRRHLATAGDLERILGKLSRGVGTPRDMNGLKQTLNLIPDLQREMKGSKSDALSKLADRFTDVTEVSEKINSILVDSPPANMAKGDYIADSVDDELDELRKIARGGKEWIASMQLKEREKTGIKSLKVGYNKVFGYYLEVTKTHQDKVPETYIRKQTLVNAERFITPELKEYEEKILGAEEKILEIEAKLFNELRQWVLGHASAIQQNGELMNEIDVSSTLAEVAKLKNYVRPHLTGDTVLKLIDSRHPVVETLLSAGEKFVANDLAISAEESQIHLITGPNMAGKSTYLRQIGLIVLMAQMGSYVPAREANIGMVDRLFTRVGASDNLAGGESTFMVEMTEAANILNNATGRSLVLFDEIGRGTATFDGLSLAWAITEHLHNTPKSQARTVFATHYHELTELADQLDRVSNFNVAVKESGDKIIFLRKIKRGSCDKSYGIHVAQMAGLPTEVISRASEILKQLILHEPLQKSDVSPDPTDQMDLFNIQESQLRKALTELDTDQMTPMEALAKLAQIKKDHDL